MPIDPTKTYIISSATNDPLATQLYVEHPLSDKTEPVIGKTTTAQPKWHIQETKPGSNVYTIRLAGLSENKRLFVENNYLWLSLTQATEFSIEPAGGSHGDNVYRLHIPATNSVARFRAEGRQVYIAKEDGTANELWYFDVFRFPQH